MSWISLAIETDNAQAEVLSEAMLELGALSTDLHDAGSGTEREQLLFDEPGEISGETWRASELTALFNADVNIPSIVQAAAELARLPSLPTYRVAYVEEQDWVRTTQAQFNPIRISPRLWVVPSWHRIPDPGAVNLTLDPGLAFGTGSHPSTHLCLAWLDENLTGGEDILDYGCGSGILAIAAAKLGAGRVVGIDIDYHAVEASRHNAMLNQCGEPRVKFCTTPMGASIGANGSWADVVVANILANPLIMLAPILMAATRAQGRIALSGILMEQAEGVMRTYRQWFDMLIFREQEGWVLLTGTRR
ncbi:MAG: 50S ribosomal protein L11 methyltransferase [Nitrosospira sp.]|nr:50S ribosomal protein L11 methyltransferase [Nitrosospira sp.]